MESTLKDMGHEMILDDLGRLSVQPLAKPETIEGHSVEELERIAAGDQADDQPPAPPAPSTVQPLSQPPSQSTDEVAALRQQVALLTQHILDQRQNGNGQVPATPSMRDTIAKQLEDAGYDASMADIIVGAMDQREKQLRSQIAQEYNLPQMQLQSDLVRLYNTYGEDFKASLPAIELVRKGDPTIPLEQAYQGVRLMREALGIGAPNNAPTAGATPSQPTVNLTPEQAKALLAKRDLMRTESGVNGTEAKPSQVKKSFGEMLHEGLTTSRRQGRAGG